MKRRLLSSVSAVAMEAARAPTGPLAAEASASSSSASTPANASSHCDAMATSIGTASRPVSRDSVYTRKEKGRGRGMGEGGHTALVAEIRKHQIGEDPDLRHGDAAHRCRSAALSGVHAEQQQCLGLLEVLRAHPHDPRPRLLA